MTKIRTIGILTSGGDAPGMNAAIRAVVRCASNEGIKCYGILSGYTGLINGEVIKIDSRYVSDIIQKGGTILGTSRCPEFINYESRKKAYDVLQAYGIDGLIVIGGNGSFAGMREFHNDFGVPCLGIPGTIDNDLSYTDFTLGFDTAVNTVINAVNNIRDTMTAHNRACIIEVMGRHCGDIALYAGIAGGAEIILVPEIPLNLDEIVKNMRQDKIKGKKSVIIILAEGVCSCVELKEKLTALIDDIAIRTVKLGYIQRGGMPTMSDRVLAARCGAKAIELFSKGDCGAKVIGIKKNTIVDIDVDVALNEEYKFNVELYNISKILGK